MSTFVPSGRFPGDEIACAAESEHRPELLQVRSRNRDLACAEEASAWTDRCAIDVGSERLLAPVFPGSEVVRTPSKPNAGYAPFVEAEISIPPGSSTSSAVLTRVPRTSVGDGGGGGPASNAGSVPGNQVIRAVESDRRIGLISGLRRVRPGARRRLRYWRPRVRRECTRPRGRARISSSDIEPDRIAAAPFGACTRALLDDAAGAARPRPADAPDRAGARLMRARAVASRCPSTRGTTHRACRGVLRTTVESRIPRASRTRPSWVTCAP